MRALKDVRGRIRLIQNSGKVDGCEYASHLHCLSLSLCLFLSLSLGFSAVGNTVVTTLKIFNSSVISEFRLHYFFGISPSDLSLSFFLAFAHLCSLTSWQNKTNFHSETVFNLTIASNSRPLIPQPAYIQGTLLNFQVTIMVCFEKAKRNFLTAHGPGTLKCLPPSLPTCNLPIHLWQSLLSVHFLAVTLVTKNYLHCEGPGNLEKQSLCWMKQFKFWI